MNHFQSHEDLNNIKDLSRIKEIMGDTFDDFTILKALVLNQNDFERAINYLLEPQSSTIDPPPPPPSQQPERQQPMRAVKQKQQQQQHLRQSITDAFTTSPLNHSSNWPSNSNWNSVSPAHSPTIDNLTQPLLDPLNEARQTTPTQDFRISDQPFQILNPQPLQLTQNPINNPDCNTNAATTTTNITTTSTSTTTTNPLLGISTNLDQHSTNSTQVHLIDDSPGKRYKAELDAAIEASLASDPTLNQLHPSPQPNVDPNSLKELSTEDEQMSKALEESLAMSGSRTLEADSKFAHPPPNNRLRPAGLPAALRVHNPHLVFLPCLLSAMYAAKPFRDRILEFKPNSQLVNQELIDHDFEGIWNGKSSWRSGENWPNKANSAEIILAIQRLFILMTHTNRSYLDVQEISLLLGYEEGEMISWSLNEPNKGCQRTYETIAEAWREVSWEIFKSNHADRQYQHHQELLSEFDDEQRLLHWKGHKLPLPLPEDETKESLLMPSADNSTTCLTLNTLDSTLNDIYSCIDAQVWLPELNQAHFLNGISEVIAFEIDRKPSSSSSTWCSSNPELLSSPCLDLQNNDSKTPFKLQSQFWVDRYLIQNRHKIIELREEISRIEGEADVSLARRTQLSKAGDKDLLSTLKATVDYLSASSQFPTADILQREKIKKEMLPKFQESLKQLETELASLDEKASTALEAAKVIFDVEEMKQIGPHELCSVVVSDGFSGRDHMWTYVKSDDGRWFKSIDKTVTEVSLQTVLSDPSGIHMNSGHIFAIYVRSPTVEESQTDSQSIPLSSLSQTNVIRDNELLEAEILESVTLTHSGSGYNIDQPIEDVQMTSDSPRSDVADAGGQLELDLSNSETELIVDMGPPLRLQGGAKSMSSAHDDESDQDRGSWDSGSEESDDDDLVELGFLKKIAKPLNVKSFTGKVGGHPIWLDPTSPLEPGSIKCSECHQPMKFLLQLNAPDDSNPDAYYRAVYVFVCSKSTCWNDSSTTSKIKSNGTSGSSVRVFRTQIGSKGIDDQPFKIKNKSLIQPKDSQLEKSLQFYKEWEIVCDLEPSNTQLDSIQHLKTSHLADKLNVCELDDSKKKSEIGIDQDSNFKETKSKVDDEFLNFQSRISRAPTQILRYLRVQVPEIEPIWVNKKTHAVEELLKKEIQVCSNCGGRRTPEFQILSTLISNLENISKKDDNVKDQLTGDDKDEDGIDFGSIIVYTCSNSCSSFLSKNDHPHSIQTQDHHDGGADVEKHISNNWVEESCLVQFFSNHGIFS